MEILLTPIFWLIDLFDTRSSDPLIRAFKKAQLGLYVYLVMSGIFLLIAWLIDSNSAEHVATNLSSMTDTVQRFVVGTFLFIAVTCLVLSVGHCWTLYRVHSKPEHFY